MKTTFSTFPPATLSFVSLLILLLIVNPGHTAPVKIERISKLQALSQLSSNDNDSILSSFQKQKSAKIISPASVKSKKLQLADGSNIALTSVSQSIFKQVDSFTIKAKKSSALMGQVKTTSLIAETADAFILTKSAKVIVSNPAQFSRESKDFAEFLKDRPKQPPLYNSLTQNEKQLIDKYFEQELPKLANNNPLKVHGKQSKDALLKAINDGYGEFEIIDSFSFAKKPLPVKNNRIFYPTFQNGPFDYSTLAQMPTLQSNVSRFQPADNRVTPLAAQPSRIKESYNMQQRKRYTVTGSTQFERDFLTGFTFGREWKWERRWNFGVGFYRLTIGGSYGYGLRLPFKVSGTASPTKIITVDTEDKAVAASARVHVDSFDGGSDFYRNIGVRSDQIFDGKEFVLEAKVYYGMKFSAFSKDWIHIKKREFGFDEGSNFKPPFGNHRESIRLKIPPEVTNTKFGGRYLEGAAEFGIALEFTGQTSVDAKWSSNTGSRDFRTYTFKNTQPKSIGTTLPPLRSNHARTSNSYSFLIKNPKYSIDAGLTPIIRGVAKIDVGVIAKSFSTGWIRLGRFTVNIGSMDFKTHSGTPNNYRIPIGEKEFTRIKPMTESASLTRAKVVTEGTYAIKPVGGQYVRAGTGNIAMLEATSGKKSTWTEFYIVHHEVVEGVQVIAIKHQKSGKFVRFLDSGNLGARNSKYGTREKFYVHRANGGILLQSMYNNKYITIDERTKYLNANLNSKKGASVLQLSKK